MGGGLINDGGVWRTTNYDEGDKFGVIGDRAMVVAASLLFKNETGLLLVALGGRGQFAGSLSVPCVAEVIKKELIDLGVTLESILEEKESANTYQQLFKIQEIWQKENFASGRIISNKLGIKRILAMINYKEELSKLKILLRNKLIRVIASEEILLKFQPKIWRSVIEKAYASPAMARRIALEEQGTRQVKDGTYKYK